MSENLHPVVGIDLGTTYSAVAAFNQYTGEAEILPNKDYPKRPETTPSVISLDPKTKRVIVGWPAKNNIAIDPDNTIIEIKREMGALFSKETLKKYQAEGQFAATETRKDPVHVFFAGSWRRPQELSAFTLMKMKEVAEKELGIDIMDAVITVPAYFTAEQRQATKEAALLAGLYPRQLIPEPTAAAICYGLDQMEGTRKVYLVYDLGGGTFDVSVITVEGESIEVIATTGDARLGGGDFDDKITEWAVAELLKPPYQINVGNNRSAREIIKAEAERAKRDLSAYKEATLALGDLQQFLKLPILPTLTLTRAQFEEMIEKLLEKAINAVNKAIELSRAKDVNINIDAILMVGGSSRIPRIREQLLDYFKQGEDFIKDDINPDEVVARGAAIMARRFKPSQPPFDITREVDTNATLISGDDEVQVTLITEHNLGVGIQNNRVSWIVDAGTKIPVSETRSDYSNPGPVEYLDVQLFQGDDDYTYGNTLIGTLKIGPMTKLPPHEHQFEVTFSLSRDGLLSTEIFHVNENKRYQGKFEQVTGFKVQELADIRAKLIVLFQPSGEVIVVVPPPAADIVPPSPPPPAAITPPPPPTTDSVPPPAPVVEPPVAQSPAVEPPATDGVAETKLIDITGKFPDEFERVVRRTRKVLMSQDVPKLLAAYNAFAKAVNEKADEEVIDDLGDELEELYRDARTNLT